MNPQIDSPAAILAHLYELLGRAVLLVISKGEKGPRLKGWQSITYEETQMPQYQKQLLDCINRGGNIGVLLGPESGYLYTIDIDDDDVAGMFLADNSVLANTLRTHGARGCNFWFRVKPGSKVPLDQAIYQLKTREGHGCGELRCGGSDSGAQTVAWGQHPNGDRYQTIVDQPVAEIDFAEIKWPGRAPGERERRKLTGKSIIGYFESKIDFSQVLLGNRWLSRRTGGFIVAPSGHGKSTLVIQCCVCWSCGRPAFGIKPAKPLRILIIQAEDDDNDVIEMSQMCSRLKLSDAETDLIRRNTRVEWLNDVTGPAFFSATDDFLTEFPSDLVLINPYTAYTGADIQDTAANDQFLRVDLSRIMTAHSCAALGIHHTPKTNFQNTGKYSWFDWMYSMSGGATLTNWARAVLVIVPSDMPGTYRFIAAKRFEKTGWQDREYWFAHSIEDGTPLWVPASQDQIACGRKGKSAGTDALLTIIPMLDPVPEAQIIHQAKDKLGISRDNVRDFLKILEHEAKVFRHLFDRPRTNPEIKYARTPQSE